MRHLKRITLAVIVLTALVAGAVYVYLVPMHGLEKQVTSRLNKLFSGRIPLRITIGDISGDLLSGVIVKDVRITTVDTGASEESLHIGRITAGYAIENLWNRQFVFDYLYLDSLDLQLQADSGGLPVWPALRRKGSKSRLPLLRTDELSLRGIRAVLAGPRDTLRIESGIVQAGVDVRDETYAIDIRQISFESSDSTLSLTAASGNVTMSGDKVALQDCYLQRGETRLRLSGIIDFTHLSGTAEFTLDALDVEEVSALASASVAGHMDINGQLAFDSTGLSGRVMLSGALSIVDFENLYCRFTWRDRRVSFDTLYGTVLGNCAVDGKGYIDFSGEQERYRLMADVRNFDLANLISGSFPSDLSGEITLAGSSFRYATMNMTVDADLIESTFDGYPLHHAAGRMVITTRDLTFPDTFRVDYFENHFRAHGSLEYKGDIALDVDVTLPNLDRYRGKLFLNQPGGRGRLQAHLSGATSDPDLRATFTSDSLWLYGIYADSASADVDIGRFLTARRGVVRASLYSGEVWGIPFDSTTTIIRLDSTRAFVDALSMRNEYAGIIGRAELDYGVYPQQLSVDTLNLSILNREFYNRGRLSAQVDSSGLQLLSLVIGDARSTLEANGRTGFDGTLGLSVALHDLPVKPWLRLFESDLGVDGLLSCRASVGGELGNPSLSLKGSVDSLQLKDLLLGDVVADVHLQDRLLTVDSAIVVSPGGRYRAVGTLYTDLALTSRRIDRLPDLPIDLKVTIDDTRFDLVSLLLPSVEEMAGTLHVDLRMSGKPSQPHLQGEAHLKNGWLKYFDLVDTLYTDSAGVIMQDNKIVIDHIETYVHDYRNRKTKRYAILEGDITVTAFDKLYYDVNVSLPREFPFRYELDDITGIIEGDLHVTGEHPPLVEGDLTVLAMRYEVNFADPGESSAIITALTSENSWNLDISVDIPSNYWIRNEDIDAEFSGTINLIREKGQYRFAGEMEILRGKGFLFDKTLRFDPGSRVIFEDIEYPNPRLDVTARTRIPRPQSPFEEAGAPHDVQLAIHVGGTLEHPEIEPLANEEGLTREDILPLLVANYYSEEGAAAEGGWGSRVSQVVASQVSQIGSRQFARLGVETFELDPYYHSGQLDLAATRFTVGLYTAPNLYVYGRSTLSFEGVEEVGFEYRLSRLLQIEGRRDEEQLHHVNLRLHWEF